MYLSCIQKKVIFFEAFAKSRDQFLTVKIQKFMKKLLDNVFLKLAHTFQKVLYQMASKNHVPKLDRGGSGFPTLSQTHGR